MTADTDALLTALSLEEKAALTAGVDVWRTVAVASLGLPALVLTDGPAGARGATVDHESLTASVCIPSGTALGASFDPDLVRQASAVVARQAKDKGAQVLLAPTVNLHRHPLWGRNFEAFSEDPLLSAELAVAYIEGVQAEGVAATVKHLVCNETEFERFTSSSDIDERTLRELYLLPFEHAVRRAGVWCLMTSYNRLNGEHVPDQEWLLRGVLREEWGFDGVVMTDWWAIIRTEEAAASGLDLEMPGPGRAFGPALAEAVAAGRADAGELDDKVRRIVALAGRVGALTPPVAAGTGGTAEPPPPAENPLDRPEDRAFLRRAATESLVLLANDGVLPLVSGRLSRIALVGPRAEQMPFMGGGSARVRPHYRLSLLDILRSRLAPRVEVNHADGQGPAGIAAAAELARSADAVVVVVGTDEQIESEGYDRTSMHLPGDQDELVRAVLAANPLSAVVVVSGAPVELDCCEGAGAVLQSFFGGQEVANAVADVLLGDAEPGGRLPTTIPLRLEHTPAFASFPGEASHARYGEGLLVGYRYYEARQLAVRFPFGHGLSYTAFDIGRPGLSADRLERGGRLRVEVPVRNVGERRGSEVVQCYVCPPGGGQGAPGRRFRPTKELRGFAKVHLEAGAAETVSIELTERAFAYYDVADTEWPDLVARRHHGPDPSERAVHRSRAGWYVDPGTYELAIGRSSAEIAHRLAIAVAGSDEALPAGAPLA